jgi:hypothetical protein
MLVLRFRKHCFLLYENQVFFLERQLLASESPEAVANVLAELMAVRTSDQSRDADMVAVCRH